jgi:phosphatidylserine/phosphatidylglycerophosphate/cardiolipin synthase-like enzyme
VSVFGEDIVIGSANADMRSFMMDSNNAMLVRNAPDLYKNYLAFVDIILANPARVKKLNQYILTTPHEKIKADDEKQFWNYIDRKFKFFQKQSEERKTQAMKEVSDLIDKVYDLTKKSLSTGKQSDQDKLNEQFKPI